MDPDEATPTATEDPTSTRSEGSAGIPTDAPTPATTDTATTDTATTDATDWRIGIPEGPLAEQARRMASLTATMQSIVDMRKKLSTAIFVPTDKSTDEERAAYYKKLGVPESIDAVKINLPDQLDPSIAPGEEEVADVRQALEGMRKAGASQAVIDEALKLHYGAKQVELSAQIEKDKRFSEQAMASLKNEWGADTEENLNIASAAANKLFGDKFEEMRQIETKDGNFLLDHPEMLRMLASIGREMGDSNFGSIVSDSQREDLRGKADEYRAKRNEAIAAGKNLLAKEYDDKEREVLAKLG